MIFTGSVSDKDITEESDFLKLLLDLIQSGKLKNGDGVVADKCFHIEKDIALLGLN